MKNFERIRTSTRKPEAHTLMKAQVFMMIQTLQLKQPVNVWHRALLQ